jgi:isoquinoline 1-oxidoreductase alpha subunit
MVIAAQVNGKDVSFAGEPDTPLLWALREELGLTGTKFGCGLQRGACSVHVDGELVRSSLPVGERVNPHHTEGLGPDGTVPAQ